jgi:transposase-like protein
VDGHAGLKHALKHWDDVRVQRCTTHKLENLRTHRPRRAQAELKRDYHRLLYAADNLAARAAYDAFVKKWSARCPAVAKSLEEAGLELLTFSDVPKAMWQSLRTTNTVENLNREFRRRTKTQASFGTEDAALIVLYGLVALRAHPAAEDRRPSPAPVVPREGMAEKWRKSVEWSTVQQPVTPSKQFPQDAGRIPVRGLNSV